MWKRGRASARKRGGLLEGGQELVSSEGRGRGKKERRKGREDEGEYGSEEERKGGDLRREIRKG